MKNLSQAEHYTFLSGLLNERQWRLYVAAEAKRIGVGGISQVAREAGVSRKTIRKGIRELEAGELYQPGERIRKQGGPLSAYQAPTDLCRTYHHRIIRKFSNGS